MELDENQTGILNLVMDDRVECEEAVRPSSFQLIHQITSADASELDELEYYILPHGSLNSNAFNLLNWFPRHKMKHPVDFFRTIQDTYCYTFARLRQWFPKQQALYGDIYSKAEEINNDQGIRKTPDKLYGCFLHFHHLYMQRMVRMFQPTEDGYIILWGAHSQAFWNVYFAGIKSLETSNGKSLTIYRLDHPEWIGINAPAK